MPPLKPLVKMLLSPPAICELLLVIVDTYGATVTVVLALTLPPLFVAVSV